MSSVIPSIINSKVKEYEKSEATCNQIIKEHACSIYYMRVACLEKENTPA